jgi:two-component system, OmpR family, alkaline phosphatase synthesis response regulator PhoP
MPVRSTSADRPMGSDHLSVGPIYIDLSGLSVSVYGRDVPLTHGEFLILVALARQPYSVMSRERLMEVLNEAPGGRPALGGRVRAVDTHITRIRKKLADAGCDCIRTMRFVGYRLVPPTHNPQKKPWRSGQIDTGS